MEQLTHDEFLKVAGTNAIRITYDEAYLALDTEPTERPRIYALTLDNQIVKLSSVHYLIKHQPTRARWISGTTINDLIRKAK